MFILAGPINESETIQNLSETDDKSTWCTCLGQLTVYCA